MGDGRRRLILMVAVLLLCLVGATCETSENDHATGGADDDNNDNDDNDTEDTHPEPVGYGSVSLWLFSGWSNGDDYGAEVYNFDGLFWTMSLKTDYELLVAAWGVAADDVWAAGFSELYSTNDWPLVAHYNGRSWRIHRIATEEPYSTEFTGIWGADGSDIYAVGNRWWSPQPQYIFDERYVAYHFDGVGWDRIRVGQRYRYLHDVWVSDNGKVFAVGVFAEPEHPADWVVQFDGDTWSEGSVVGPDWGLYWVWGTSPQNVYATGVYGGYEDDRDGLFHFNGQTWSALEVGLPGISELWDVDGASASEIYMIAMTGTLPDTTMHVLRGDGTTWQDTGLQVGGPEGWLFVVGSNDVYATAGWPYDGRLWHYDGTAWTDVSGWHMGVTGPMWGVQLDDR
jgi:hypothetical protein